MSPFGSINCGTKFGAMCGRGSGLVLQNLSTDVWWLSHQDFNKTAMKNQVLLVRYNSSTKKI